MPGLTGRFVFLAAVLAVLGGSGTLYAQLPPPKKDDTETAPAFASQVPVNVNETVSVSDSPRIVPSASITLTETVGVADTPTIGAPDVLPPVSIVVTETVGVTDATGETPSAGSAQATPVPATQATPAPAAQGAPRTDTGTAPAIALPTVSMAEGLTEGFCAMAQWRAGQVLSVYDVMAQAQKQARDLAAGLSVTLTLDFADMGPLRQNVQSAADAVCSAADSQAAKAAIKCAIPLLK